MKKLILSIALCCAATNFFAQNADPAQLVNDGKAALEAKNYQEAYTKFSTYIFTKLLQKREMRKDIVIELSYKGFSRASDYS